MKSGKAAGPSGVAFELLQICEVESVKKLADVIDNLLQGRKMVESWRKSNLISICKRKRDVRSCGNHRSVKFLEHGIKVIGPVI